MAEGPSVSRAVETAQVPDEGCAYWSAPRAETIANANATMLSSRILHGGAMIRIALICRIDFIIDLSFTRCFLSIPANRIGVAAGFNNAGPTTTARNLARKAKKATWNLT